MDDPNKDTKLPSWFAQLGKSFAQWRDRKAAKKREARAIGKAIKYQIDLAKFQALEHLHERKKKPTPTCAKCGISHMREGKDECSKCSGWACPHCGRGKTPEQSVCNRPVCKTKETIRLKKEEKNRAKTNPNEVVRKFYR